jgi:hypothetical protein
MATKKKQIRIDNAKHRENKYALLTVEQKIKDIDERFGVGKGAKEQRAKLQEQLMEP